MLDVSQLRVLTSLSFGEIEARERLGDFPPRRQSNPIPLWPAAAINGWLDDRDLDPAWAGRAALDSALAGRFVNEATLVAQSPKYEGEVRSATALAEHAVPIDQLAHAASGIYFLWRRGAVVYVGQTRIGLPRILSHVGTKEFESFSFVRCELDRLDEAERAYIDALMPEYNRDWITVGRRKAAAGPAGDREGDGGF